MKFNICHSARQRRLPHCRKLPSFLRSETLQLAIDGDIIFPRNAALLFVDECWDDCTCYIRGLLFLWRLFFALSWYQNFPNEPVPRKFYCENPMELIKIRGHTWIYEFYNYSCDCYPILKNLIELVTKAFIPVQI